MKIFVYGDSYACPGPRAEAPGWTDMLGKSMSAHMFNRAISGGSTEKAMLNFLDDFRNGNIDADDIIIFVKSTPGRLHLQFQNERPETASMYLGHGYLDESEFRHRWYVKNKKYLLWHIANSDNKLHDLNHEAYFHTLKSFAAAHPKNTVVYLQNSPHYAEIPGIDCPENFLCPDLYLNHVSCNEFITDKNYREWTRYIAYDLRENHLCIPNLKILANLVEESIKTRNVDNFTMDKFESRLYDAIKELDEYLYWIDKGYFYDTPWRREWFNKK